MNMLGTYEAKTKFTALLRRAAKGERITIGKHGVPVATLQAFEASKVLPVKDVIADIRRFRSGRNLKGLAVRQLIEEGRR